MMIGISYKYAITLIRSPRNAIHLALRVAAATKIVLRTLGNVKVFAQSTIKFEPCLHMNFFPSFRGNVCRIIKFANFKMD